MEQELYRSALVIYISVLESSADNTHRAEDRPKYQRHLAEAARMLVAIEKYSSITRLKELVASERRSYGWDFLSEESGDKAESAFNTFAHLVEEATTD